MNKFTTCLFLIFFIVISLLGYGLDIDILKLVTFINTETESGLIIQFIPIIGPVLLAYSIHYLLFNRNTTN